MKETDWNLVIKLKEFREYLCNKDLIQLSMGSRKMRILLAKDALNTLYLHSFTSSRAYSSLFIKEETDQHYNHTNLFINPYKPLNSEYIDSKREFISDLKLFKGSPRNLVVNDYRGYHYLLNEIPKIFSNLSTLVLHDSAFTMDVLQNLLDNLKCLKGLDLTFNLIFHNAEISNGYTINYPISLRSLKLGENYVAIVQDTINSIGVNRYIGRAGLNEFNSTYQHLPNLAKFEYYVLENYPEENGDLIEFIRLNPQLKSLKLSGSYFNFSVFDIIKDYEYLTHFEFKCFHHWSNLQGYEMPVLRNIKHLHIEVIHEKIDEIFINNFPNVTELVIESSWGINNNEKNLINSFQNLKSLKFISNDKYECIEKLTLPKLHCLEKLEINLNYEEGRFEDIQCDVSTFNESIIVNYTKNDNYTPFERLKLTEELAKHWDLYYFPHKLSFIKNP